MTFIVTTVFCTLEIVYITRLIQGFFVNDLDLSLESRVEVTLQDVNKLQICDLWLSGTNGLVVSGI